MSRHTLTFFFLRISSYSAKPPLAPYKQTIVYDYEIDESVPLDGPTQVTFDLPERVTIVARSRSLQASGSTEKN
jgi:hypothetical protein